MRLKGSAAFIAVALVFVFFAQGSFAANPFYNGTTMFVYGTASTRDFTHQALINTYIPLGGFNATQVVYRDISTATAAQVRAQMVQDVANNPSASYVMGSVGHGDPSSSTATYLTGPLDRQQMSSAINTAYSQNGVSGWMFEDACGSGATCNLWKPSSTPAIEGVFTSTKPGVVGNDTNYGNGWTSDYGEAIKGMLNNAGKGGANDPDVNKDGILSGKEVGDYLDKNNPGQFKIKPGSEDKPMYYKDKERAAGAQESRESGSMNVITKYKYAGPETNKFCHDGDFILSPDYKDLPRIEISDAKQCELAENIHYRNLKAVALGNVPLVAAGPYPVSPFCQENRGQGTPKKIGLPKAEEGAFTTDCKENDFGNVPSERPNIPGYEAQGGSAGAAAPGGFDSILAALMKSLLGGQGGQAQQGQNPYGAGGGSGQRSCALQGLSPVCGADGKTYNNPCYLTQSQTVQVSEGVCPITQDDSGAGNASNIISKLSQSGVPSSLLSTLTNAVATILSSLLAGSQVGETVIR